MRILLFTLLLELFIQKTNGQTYDHYRYNNAGVPEKSGYTTVRQQSQFTPYTPSVNTNLYREVLENKQASADKNVESLRQIISKDWELIDNLTKPDYAELKTAYTDLLKTYTSEMSGSKYDYSNNQTYIYWYNLLVKIHNDLLPFQN